MKWETLRETYRKIVKRYEVANFLITWGHVDRWRREAVGLLYLHTPLKILDAGAGPGNMARHFGDIKYVVALDLTPEMLKTNGNADDKVVGVFEQMPFRSQSFDVVCAGYSLHAAVDIERAVGEFSRVASYHVVVSIGKPDNKILRGLLYIYVKYVVPTLVRLVTSRDTSMEYRKIYDIIKSIPINSVTKKIIERYTSHLIFRERGLGAVYIYVAKSAVSKSRCNTGRILNNAFRAQHRRL
ncbi:MAG: class I SAM-dependent methyltransferase [Pyrobaculum sp.]